MKALKRFAAVLRVAGILLLVIAITAGIYGFASNTSLWNAMSENLQAAGVSAGLAMRLQFTSRYYLAMSDVTRMSYAPVSARVDAARQRFDGFLQMAEKGEAEHIAQFAEDAIVFFSGGFSYADFLEAYELRERNSDTIELRDIFEYLDSFSVPAGKPGKALPSLSLPSCQGWFETYYDGFAMEHGEHAGTFLEFMRVVESLIRSDERGGYAIITAKDYMDAAFTYQRYADAMEAIHVIERMDNTGNILDDFAVFAREAIDAQMPDTRVFFEAAYAQLAEIYPSQTLPGFDVFMMCAMELMRPGAAFDGSAGSIVSAMRLKADMLKNVSFATYLSVFSRELVIDADANRRISFAGELWLLVGYYLSVFAAGIISLIGAALLMRIIRAWMMKHREISETRENPDILLEVRNLKQYFRSGDYINKAVDDVSFVVKKGEVLGLVGESGCGKTTTGRAIINLYDPTQGDVYYQGLRISSTKNSLPVLARQLRTEYAQAIKKRRADTKESIKNEPSERTALRQELRREVRKMKRELRVSITKAQTDALESFIEKSKAASLYREKRLNAVKAGYDEERAALSGEAARERERRYLQDKKIASKASVMSGMQMIFQDPIASIDPRMTVREIIAEGLKIRGVRDKAYIDEKVYEMLELVGLVREHADRYPHEFSGGQRQRIGIARAIVLEPNLIIADEPISALDVSVQAQVINLLNELREKMGLTLIFIAHNLAVVKYFSDRVAVMYYGKIVELAASEELFMHPLHPYTKSLLSAIPYPDPAFEKLRKRVEYNPTLAHDYSKDKPDMHEIRPGHFIHGNAAELAVYESELNE